MTEYLIRNSANSGKLLCFDRTKWTASEVDQDSVDSNSTAMAIYTRTPKGFLGVVASERGPFLFTPTGVYYFTDPSWSVDVERKDSTNVFRVFEGAEVVLDLEYSRPPVDDLDPWADEESEDFFIWLNAKRDDGEFIEMWTAGA